MASLLLHSFRPMMLGLGLGLSLASFQTLHQRAMRLDSGPIISGHSHRKNAQTPVLRTGQLNPNGVKQISTGSIIGNLTGNGQQMAAHEKKLGLCVGLAVSTFSRSLAILLGLLVVGLQWASSYGINVIPYQKLQKCVTSIDLRSVVQDNVAFKLSFGTTFALAAFMHF